MSTITLPSSPPAKPQAAFGVLGAISASHLINDMMQSLILAMYPVLQGNFQLNFAQIGLITLTYQLTASLFQPLVGLYTDKRSTPYSLPIGMCFTLAGLVLLAFAPNFHTVLLAAALAVAFATRGAMAGSRDSVEVLHLVGADDEFIAREFQNRFITLGLRGGGAGGLAAVIAIALLGWLASAWSATPEADQLQAMFGAFEIGWSGYGVVVLVAVIVAAIAGLVSRVTVRNYLKAMS